VSEQKGETFQVQDATPIIAITNAMPATGYPRVMCVRLPSEIARQRVKMTHAASADFRYGQEKDQPRDAHCG
jgi:hypothetical protein